MWVEALVDDAHVEGRADRDTELHEADRILQAAQVHRPLRNLRVLRLVIQLIKELHKLVTPALPDCQEATLEHTAEVLLRDDRHRDDEKTRRQRLIELARAFVAVVHRRDETCRRMQLQPLIARYIDDPPVIQHTVQHRQRLVLRHVDLVEHREAAVFTREVDRPRFEHDPTSIEAVRPDHRRRIHPHMEGHIPHRALKQRRQILAEDVLARRLRPRQQQISPAEKRRDRRLPDLPAIIRTLRRRDSRHQLLC